jgi:hypothetical protein
MVVEGVDVYPGIRGIGHWVILELEIVHCGASIRIVHGIT